MKHIKKFEIKEQEIELMSNLGNYDTILVTRDEFDKLQDVTNDDGDYSFSIIWNGDNWEYSDDQEDDLKEWLEEYRTEKKYNI